MSQPLLGVFGVHHPAAKYSLDLRRQIIAARFTGPARGKPTLHEIATRFGVDWHLVQRWCADYARLSPAARRERYGVLAP